MYSISLSWIKIWVYSVVTHTHYGGSQLGAVFGSFLRALFILWWFKLSLMTWKWAKPSGRASCLSLCKPVSFVWLRCVYAPQAMHCMCVSVCVGDMRCKEVHCAAVVPVCICTLWTNILNEHNEHTLNAFSKNTLWTNNLKIEHSEHIMNKHSKDTFLLCANNTNNNIYIWHIQYLSHSSRTEMHPINTHYEFLIHIANCPSAAYGVLFSLSHLHIFHLRYCKQLCKLCELFVILNSCCLFCILYTRDVL